MSWLIWGSTPVKSAQEATNNNPTVTPAATKLAPVEQKTQAFATPNIAASSTTTANPAATPIVATPITPATTTTPANAQAAAVGATPAVPASSSAVTTDNNAKPARFRKLTACCKRQASTTPAGNAVAAGDSKANSVCKKFLALFSCKRTAAVAPANGPDGKPLAVEPAKARCPKLNAAVASCFSRCSRKAAAEAKNDAAAAANNGPAAPGRLAKVGAVLQKMIPSCCKRGAAAPSDPAAPGTLAKIRKFGMSIAKLSASPLFGLCYKSREAKVGVDSPKTKSCSERIFGCCKRDRESQIKRAKEELELAALKYATLTEREKIIKMGAQKILESATASSVASTATSPDAVASAATNESKASTPVAAAVNPTPPSPQVKPAEGGSWVNVLPFLGAPATPNGKTAKAVPAKDESKVATA